MNELSPDTVLIRNERLAWRVLEGGAVILFPEAGTLHRLNGTGTRVWEHLDGRRSLSDIAFALSDEYSVEPREAVEQIVTLARDLVATDLAMVQQPALVREHAQARD